ncbi:MAG: hypothetical protein WC665_05630 [Sulfurimonas sp.]
MFQEFREFIAPAVNFVISHGDKYFKESPYIVIFTIFFIILVMLYKYKANLIHKDSSKRYCKSCQSITWHSETGLGFEEKRNNGGYPFQCNKCDAESQ